MPQLLSIKSEQKVEDPLELSEFTIGEVLKLMSDNDAHFKESLEKSRVLKVEAKEISGGKGVMSFVYRTQVHFEDSQIDSFSFVMKVPTDAVLQKIHEIAASSQEEFASEWERVKRMHNTECRAYRLLSQLHEFPLPRLYASIECDNGQKGLILMEDLQNRGVALEVWDSATQEQCVNVAKHVANFQSFIKSLDSKTYKSKFEDNFHTLEDVNTVWKSLIRKITAAFDNELQEKVEKFLALDLIALSKYILIELPQQYKALTLIHADIWVNNMLFEGVTKNGHQQIGDEVTVIFDWQTLFEGNPLLDVARFMVACVDSQIRHRIERQLVDQYYSSLSEQLEKCGQKVEFTREQTHELYDLCIVQQVPLIIIMFGVVLGPLQSHPECAQKMGTFLKRVSTVVDDGLAIGEKHGLFEKFKL